MPPGLGFEALFDDVIWDCCDGLCLDAFQRETRFRASYLPLGFGRLLCNKTSSFNAMTGKLSYTEGLQMLVSEQDKQAITKEMANK